MDGWLQHHTGRGADPPLDLTAEDRRKLRGATQIPNKRDLRMNDYC